MYSFVKSWRFWVVIILPIIFLPLMFIHNESKKFQCAYVILIMGGYWMTEALPLPITALLPMVLFPTFGILGTSGVAANFMKESGMMFIGGISLALGLEYSGLHKRIALKIILFIGTSPWKLLFGIMITTFLLSCWIVVNTAVAAMMVPIILGIVDILNDPLVQIENKASLKSAYLMGVAYGANIGGTAVIIGSNPNLVFNELIASENISQDDKYTDLNFVTWFGFNFPIAFLSLLLTWLIVGMFHFGIPKFTKEDQDIDNIVDLSKRIEKLLKLKYKELGPLTFHELSVSICFGIAISLWFCRDPKFIPGWIDLFPKNNGVEIGNSTVAIAVVILMFIIPKELGHGDSCSWDGLLNWKYLQAHFPWNVILLVGGGLAISDGANKSGLSKWVGEGLQELTEELPHWALLLIFLIFCSILTEIISNAAAVSLLTPILLALSKELNIHPLYLSLPCAIACQYAFILPTSNPPNTIVFTAGNLRMSEMIKVGIWLNFSCLLILYFMSLGWGQVIFSFSNYEYKNITSTTM